MLARTLLRLQVLSPGTAQPRHLRAFVSNLVEQAGNEGHHANVKPFTVAPPTHSEDGFTLPVTTLDRIAHDRLLRQVTGHLDADTRLPFGGLEVRFASQPWTVDATIDFDQLFELADEHPTVNVDFVTPTVFRHGRRLQLPFPLPSQVFGHYRSRWNTFAPDNRACQLAFDELGLEVVAFEGRSGRVVDGHRRRTRREAAGNRSSRLVEVDYLGYLGYAAYAASGRGVTSQARRWLHALAAFGVFSGTGANTTIGMGVTRYLGAANESVPNRTD